MSRSGAAPGRGSWRAYIEGFHQERPGITERVLEQCRDEAGRTPYHWEAAALAPNSSVLDLACGSGPLHRLRNGSWVGLDLSPAELGAAAARGAGPLALGDAGALPFDTAAFDAVVCSMALMVVQPPARAITEIARVLRPAGTLVVLLPATRPLRLADRLRYVRLLVALRRARLAYPNDDVLADLPAMLDRAGLTPVDDQRRRFPYTLATAGAARELVASLYLPGVDGARTAGATRVVEGWVGTTLGIPLRRIVAHRTR